MSRGKFTVNGRHAERARGLDISLSGVALQNWVEDAACAGYPDPDLFYEHTSSQLYELSLVVLGDMCLRCPVISACLDSALEFETAQRQVHGFRAGLTEDERKQIVSGKLPKDVVIEALTSARERVMLGESSGRTTAEEELDD